MISISISIEEYLIICQISDPCPIWPPALPVNLTYFADSLDTVFKNLTLKRLQTFHIPTLMSILHCLGCSKEAFPSLGPCVIFCNMLNFYGGELLVPCPIPKLGDHPLSAVHDC
jgi:hypothetical protein